MRFYDPDDAVLITRRRLPHWAQAGTVVFITWRTADSLPLDVLRHWREDRARWLRAHDISPDAPTWREQLHRRLGVTDRFWQPESFDHLVRHEAQFQRLRAYIRDNPAKARLHPDEYRHWTSSHST
jgi:hypothetical protein